MLRNWLFGCCLLISAPAATGASRPAEEAQHGMVVSSQHLASEIGAAILKQGGNAVDAAVAVGYAQAITNACCGNIGGGGFMLLHLTDKNVDRFISFRETAPAAATANMYLDAQGNPIKGARLLGYLSAGVPGTVLGLETALREYGILSREAVIGLARKSGGSIVQFIAIISYWTGLLKSRAECRRVGL